MAGELGKVHLPLEQLEETLSKLTVPELQQRLKKRGLRKTGVKAKLIQRLAEVCFLLPELTRRMTTWPIVSRFLQSMKNGKILEIRVSKSINIE